MRGVLSYLTVALFAPILILISFVLLIFVYALQVFGKKARIRAAQLCYALWHRAVVVATLSRVRVIGKKKIPRGEPYVIYANHSSFFDIPVLSGYLFPEAAYAARESLKYWGPIGIWVLAADGVLIEQRGTKRELRLIFRIIDKVKNGRPFIVFPEGTRSWTGKLGELKTGSLKIAQRANAKIVPVRIEGTRTILPRGSKWPRPGDVTIFVGDIIEPQEVEQDSTAVLKKLADHFRGRMDSPV